MTKPTLPDLASIRQTIDRLDEQIQSLISERAQIAQQVGATVPDMADQKIAICL